MKPTWLLLIFLGVGQATQVSSNFPSKVIFLSYTGQNINYNINLLNSYCKILGWNGMPYSDYFSCEESEYLCKDKVKSILESSPYGMYAMNTSLASQKNTVLSGRRTVVSKYKSMDFYDDKVIEGDAYLNGPRWITINIIPNFEGHYPRDLDNNEKIKIAPKDYILITTHNGAMVQNDKEISQEILDFIKTGRIPADKVSKEIRDRYNLLIGTDYVIGEMIGCSYRVEPPYLHVNIMINVENIEQEKVILALAKSEKVLKTDKVREQKEVEETKEFESSQNSQSVAVPLIIIIIYPYIAY